jgi:ATP-dependent DNA ligase
MKTIWPYLGLGKHHRPSGRTVQKVQNRKDASAKMLKDKLEVAQVKKDGVYCAVTIFPYGYDEQIEYVSRTGKLYTNIPDYLLSFIEKDLPHAVYICELCCDTLSLEELSGAVNPNRIEPYDWKHHKPYCVFHDHLTLHEFKAGASMRTYMQRFDFLKEVLDVTDTFQLIETLSVIPSMMDNALRKRLEDAAIKVRSEEGVVYKYIDGDWVAGRKNWNMTKVVKGVDYDLNCVGVQIGKPGTKREGQVTNLMCEWRKYGLLDGERMVIPVDLGKGWTETDRIKYHDSPHLITGKVVHVHGLAVGSKGSIRLPKAQEIRIDKTFSDFVEWDITLSHLMKASVLTRETFAELPVSANFINQVLKLEDEVNADENTTTAI